MAASGGSRELFRGLLREFRQMHPKQSLREIPAFNYTLRQFREYDVTSQKYCRALNEMNHVGETYLCMLQSLRKHQEISKLYNSGRERSIEESAHLVGLNLPKSGSD